MMRSSIIALSLGAAALLAILAVPSVTPAEAQNRAAPANRRADPFAGFGGNSKDPIRIDANKLEVFEKEEKAIYSGDVVAVRGATVTRATQMIIFFDNKNKNGNGGAARPATPAGAANTGDTQNLRRIEFKGPVSVVDGTRTATADEMVYDAAAKTVTLRGKAVVADGPNIQRGELMTYNTETATVQVTSPGGRVQGVFTPGSQNETPRR
jgi:lipopolysaccharide export system protein LptA